MKSLINFCLIFCVILGTACSTAEIRSSLDAYSAVKTAPIANQLVWDYVKDDPVTVSEIELPMAALKSLYDLIQRSESEGDTLEQFAEKNLFHGAQVSLNWRLVVAAINGHAVRNEHPIPPALISFRKSVESAYAALGQRVNSGFGGAPELKEYGRILLKIIAAKNGIIV